MTETYLNNERHKLLTEKLAAIEPCPFAGRVTPDQIAIVLGEFGEIWPEAVEPKQAP